MPDDPHFSARITTAPDAMMAAAAHVEREYGYGYRIGLAQSEWPCAVFEVIHGDGSRFNLIADRWGNVQRIPDDAERKDAVLQVLEMARVAVTP